MPHSADHEFDGFSGCSYNSLSSVFLNYLNLLNPQSPNRIVAAAMSICFRQKMMNLVLSALVLAWGFVTPEVQHAHAGGNDFTHRHSTADEMACPDSHDHGSDNEHHEHATLPDVSLLADSVVHLHWQLFGMGFSMPVPETPADGNGDQGADPPAFVRVMNEVVPALQSGPSLDRVVLAAVCASSGDAVRDLEPVPRPPSLVTSIPLCDSVRFERSGVLLA